MHQVGLSVYSTVVVTRGCGELRPFNYSCGQDIPGVYQMNRVSASRRETNMNVSCQLVDEETTWIGFGWSVAAVTPAAFTPNGVAYRVTQEDVADFLQAAFIRLFAGGGKPYVELVPDQHAVQHDEAGWRQRVPLPGKLQARRLEKFWAELSWPRTQPMLSTRDSALAVTVRLMTEAEGVEFIGKYEDLAKNPKEKLFVAIGKEGLEQLLEDIMWWPTNGGEKVE